MLNQRWRPRLRSPLKAAFYTFLAFAISFHHLGREPGSAFNCHDSNSVFRNRFCAFSMVAKALVALGF